MLASEHLRAFEGAGTDGPAAPLGGGVEIPRVDEGDEVRSYLFYLPFLRFYLSSTLTSLWFT